MEIVTLGHNHYWLTSSEKSFVDEHMTESATASAFVAGGRDKCVIRFIRSRLIVNKPKTVTVAINEEVFAKVANSLPKVVETVCETVTIREMRELPKFSHKEVSALESVRFNEKRDLLNKAILDYKKSRVNYYAKKSQINAMPLKATLNRLNTKIAGLNKPVEKIALGRKYSAKELEQLKYFYEETRKTLLMKISKEAALIEIALEEDNEYCFLSAELAALEMVKKQERSKVTNHLKWFGQYRNIVNGKATKTASVKTPKGEIFQCSLTFKVSETKTRGY
ncbi:MAG: hypothetical protein PHT13_00035 [Methanosarcina sp.]|nr:hypothetical protein [Methanosarcina sp.]